MTPALHAARAGRRAGAPPATAALFTLLACVAIAAAGCKADAPPPAVDGGAAAPAPAAAAAARPPAADGAGAPRPLRGIDDPANDPALATAARAVAACAPSATAPREGAASCPPLAELSRVVGQADPASAFDTLTRFLAAEGPTVPAAAADLLRQRTWPRAVTGDPRRLDALLAALQQPQAPAVAEALATVAGRFRLEDARRRGQVLRLVREHALPAARKGLLAHLLHTNHDLPAVFETVRDAATADPAVAVRSAALAAFWNLGPERRADVVPIWLEALRSPEPAVAAKAAYLLGHWNKGVEEAFPEVLGETHRRAAEGTITWDFLSGLFWYVQNGQPFVDRQAVFDAARAVLANPANSWMARNKALDVMQRAGVQGFAAAAAPYAGDPEPLVAAHAKRLLGRP